MAVCLPSPERQSLFDTKRNALLVNFISLSENSEKPLPTASCLLTFPSLTRATKSNLSIIKREIVFFFSSRKLPTENQLAQTS
jgi:hypothetical protein